MAKKIKIKLKNDPFVWVVAYIDSKFLKHTEAQLNKYPEYAEVEAYIPTVKILRKTFKKENFFEEVPLLFNYGFFKVPRKYARHKDWLDDMQRNISCIYGWVKDPANTLREKPRLKVGNKGANGIGPGVATATSKEIARLIQETVNIGAHDSNEINLLKIGDPIVLRGYPWEGVNAEVTEIDPKKQNVMVKIRIFDQMKEVKVSFDNVFFTIYHKESYNDALSNNLTIDGVEGNKRFEKIQKKKQREE